MTSTEHSSTISAPCLASFRRTRLASIPTPSISAAPDGDLASSPSTRDRKSTRLNSSHLGISYAVFCLKKKKTSHASTVPSMAVTWIREITQKNLEHARPRTSVREHPYYRPFRRAVANNSETTTSELD